VTAPTNKDIPFGIDSTTMRVDARVKAFDEEDIAA